MIPIGPVVISADNSEGNWSGAQEPLIGRMNPTLLKFHMPYATPPEAFTQIHARCPRLQTVILRTDNVAVSWAEVDQVLAPWLPSIKANFKIQFWLELGNEPNADGWPGLASYETELLQTLQHLAPLRAQIPNLKVCVSAPTQVSDIAYVIDPKIQALIDGIATHLYGWSDMPDGAGDGGKWNDVLATIEQRSQLPILISEMGIDDHHQSPSQKMWKYLAWARQAPARVIGVAIWCEGLWKDNPTYEIDDAAADVLNSGIGGGLPAPAPPPAAPQPAAAPPPADDGRHFPETGHTIRKGFRAYWEANPNALVEWGYPLTEEFSENGVTVQYFERARFEWHPGSNPQHYDVLLGRVAAELFDLRYPKGV